MNDYPKFFIKRFPPAEIMQVGLVLVKPDEWIFNIDFYVYKNYNLYTFTYAYISRYKVRTNIEIDDKLMDDALQATGLKTKKDAVELGLKTLIRLKKQENIKNFRGRLKWTGDLDDMRSIL